MPKLYKILPRVAMLVRYYTSYCPVSVVAVRVCLRVCVSQVGVGRFIETSGRIELVCGEPLYRVYLLTVTHKRHAAPEQSLMSTI